MNIFILNNDPTIAARLHCDKHVVKMILETAQLLSTAHRELDDGKLDEHYDNLLYKSTHKNHPCAIWVRESINNYDWTFKLLEALSNEYTFRYEKVHKSWTKLAVLLCSPPVMIPETDMTPFAQCMPVELKGDDAVEAYQRYYREKSKTISITYKKRSIPNFMK